MKTHELSCTECGVRDGHIGMAVENAANGEKIGIEIAKEKPVSPWLEIIRVNGYPSLCQFCLEKYIRIDE